MHTRSEYHQKRRAITTLSISFPRILVELNRFAVGVASAVSNLEALPKHNPYMMSGLY